jgi:hypothetical protein
MPGKVSSENYMLEIHHIGNYKEFSFIYSSLQCSNEDEDCEKAVVERIVAKHQKIRKLIRMTHLSMKECQFRYLFPFVGRPRKPSVMKLFPH